MNYYPHHIGDYAKDAGHVSMIEDGAYRRMMDAYYSTEKPLPLDRPALYRLVRAQSKAERSAVDSILKEFFKETADGWRNKRCEEELANAQAKSAKASASAAKRWHSDGTAKAMRTHSEGNAPKNQEPRTNKELPPSGVFDFGIALLGEQGVQEKSARSFIGSLLKEWDDATVEEALRAAVGKVNVQAYVRGVLKNKPVKAVAGKPRLAL